MGALAELKRLTCDDLISVLVECLERNLGWKVKEFKQLDDITVTIVANALQQEQISILELLFAMA